MNYGLLGARYIIAGYSDKGMGQGTQAFVGKLCMYLISDIAATDNRVTIGSLDLGVF